MRILRHYGPVILGCVLFAGLTAWLQWVVLDASGTDLTEADRNTPDYYIQDLVFQGIDDSGNRYELQADRMTHDPRDDHAVLANPRIVQRAPGLPPRLITADQGQWDNRTSRVTLIGHVWVVEGEADARERVYMGETMVVILDHSGG